MSAPLGDVHASNLLTYGGLAAALAAVAMAVEHGSFAGAGAMIAVAALADTFDGRFARSFSRTERQRQIGAQLDSLVDAIVFGLAPIVVASALPGRSGGVAGAAWWAAAFCYVLATVTRLSFFTIEQDETRFVGVPTPAIALIWSTCLLWPVAWWAVPFVATACAIAMVAPVIIPRPRGAALACFALWAVSLVALHGVHLLR
jgi:phosphatidylserine synthase